MIFANALAKSSRRKSPVRNAYRSSMIEDLEPRTLMTRLTGIDVSYYQGTAQSASTHINWTSVKNSGLSFALIRSSYGRSSADADIAYNATNALAAGMYVGFYHYAYYSVAGNTAIKESTNFYNRIKNYIAADGKHIMPMLDIEEGSTVADGGTLSNWINAFCSNLQSLCLNNLGLVVNPMIYVSASPANSYFDSTIPLNYPLCVAQYPNTLPDVQTGEPSGNGTWQNGTSPSYYNSWAFWQYTSSGSVPGISGRVDMDVFQGDLAALQDYVIGTASSANNARFAVGTTVKNNYALNAWDTGKANGTVLASIPAGTTGTVLDGPIYGNSFWRYKVQFSNGITGWVADYQGVGTSSPYNAIDWLTGTVVTSVSSTAANGSYKAGSVIPITVTFNNPVTVTGTPRILLKTSAGGSTAVNYTSGSGTNTLTFNYTVAAGHISGDLTYASNTALIFNNGTIKDSLGNYATLNIPQPTASGSLGANKNIVIDTTAPTITNVTSTLANGAYAAGTIIPITVAFSEVMTVAGGMPTLALNSGGVATYAAGSGTTSLIFNYTVAAGQNAADLDYSSISALALAGATIRDAALNNATLTLTAPGVAGSLGANKDLVVDTSAPGAFLVNPAAPAWNAAWLDLSVAYADSLAGVDVSTLDNNDLLITGPHGFSQIATFVSVNVASDGTPRTATYRIAAPGGTWDLYDNGQYSASLAANQVSDTAGNAAPGHSLGSFTVAIPNAHADGDGTLTIDFSPDNSFATSLTVSNGNLVVYGNGDTEFYPLASLTSVLLNTTAGQDALTLYSTIPLPLSFANGAPEVVAIPQANVTLDVDLAGSSLSVTGGGSVLFNTTQHLAALSLAPGASADIQTNDLVIIAGAAQMTATLSALRQYLYSGSLFSSTANADPQHLQAVGYIQTDDDTILARATVRGDANLSGAIDFDDYALTDRSLHRNLPAGSAFWSGGDFNYDGTVDAADYAALDAAYANGAPAAATVLARQSQFGSDYIAALTTLVDDAPVPTPSLLLATNKPAKHKKPVAFKLSVTPGSPTRRITYRIDWDNDGVVDQVITAKANRVLKLRHAFRAAGHYGISVTATDQSGLTSAPVTLALIVV